MPQKFGPVAAVDPDAELIDTSPPLAPPQEDAPVRVTKTEAGAFEVIGETSASGEVVIIDPPAPEPEPDPIQLVEHSPEDIDRLWDWIRQDGPDKTKEFDVATSVELHAKVAWVRAKEESDESLMRALYVHGVHVGFVSLYPILHPLAHAHLYLGPAHRGRGLSIARFAFHLARTARPDLHLVVSTSDSRVARFAQRVGFTQTTYLLMEPTDE